MGDRIEAWSVLARQSLFRVNELAELMHCSPRQLQRLFKRELGCTPKSWLDEQRAQEATLLLGSGSQIKAVAVSLGFKDCSQFCAWFKKRFATTPCEWRDARDAGQ